MHANQQITFLTDGADNIRDLNTICTQNAPMQYNTALGFLLGGIGLLAIIWQKSCLALKCGIIVTLLGLFTLVQYIFNINLGIYQLL